MNIKDTLKRTRKVWSVYLLLLVILIIFYAFIIQFPVDKSLAHLLDLVRQMAPLVFVALGQTVVMLVGGIDLSVGAVASLSNIITANIMMGDPNRIPAAILLNILICAGIGAINGVVIVRIKLPAFLVTLAMASIIRGAYLLYTGGAPKGSIALEFRSIASEWVGQPSSSGIFPGLFPVAGLIWVIVFAVLAFFLYRTNFGRKIYATGGNPRASFLSGIPTKTITVAAYSICAALAGMSGLMHSALIGVALLHVGDNYLMDSIAASCIGGTTFAGGQGGIIGTIAGVFIITVLGSIMTMMGISAAGKFIVLGVLMIAILGANFLVSKTSRS